MIATSPTKLTIAIMATAGLLLGALTALYDIPTVEIVAAGASVDAKQGNAFADLPTAVIATRTITLTTSSLQAVTPVNRSTSTRTPTAVAPSQSVVAEELDPSTVLTSLRPNVRPEGLASPQPPKPQRQTQSAIPCGNANQNATAGHQSNTTQRATASSSGSNAQAAAPAPRANSQAVSNYPGQVMRRISRVRKPRTNAHGPAVVSFSVSGSGGLARLGIARSSGNAQLDQMALTVVQRAAPFPAPPSGAQTRYSVEISGR